MKPTIFLVTRALELGAPLIIAGKMLRMFNNEVKVATMEGGSPGYIDALTNTQLADLADKLTPADRQSIIAIILQVEKVPVKKRLDICYEYEDNFFEVLNAKATTK